VVSGNIGAVRCGFRRTKEQLPVASQGNFETGNAFQETEEQVEMDSFPRIVVDLVTVMLNHYYVNKYFFLVVLDEGVL